MSEIRKQQHFAKDIFDSWQQKKLNCQQEEEFLEHIGECTFCAEKFAGWMEEEIQIEPPAYLRDEISKRTRELDVQTAVKMKHTSEQMQLMIYSLKVGLGVAASIFLLTVTTSVQKMNIEIPRLQQSQMENKEKRESLPDKLKRGSSFVAETLNEVSNNLFYIEFEGSKEQK